MTILYEHKADPCHCTFVQSQRIDTTEVRTSGSKPCTALGAVLAAQEAMPVAVSVLSAQFYCEPKTAVNT